MSDQCTEISAQWCPIHGECTCRNIEVSMDDEDCPLHSSVSDHGLPELTTKERAAMDSLPVDFIDHLLAGERAKFHADGTFSHWELLETEEKGEQP